LAANDYVSFHPQQQSLEVIVDAPPVNSSSAPAKNSKLHCRRGINQWPPVATGLIVHFRGHRRDRLAKVRRRPQAAARGQNFSEVFGQAFINPEQIALHRLLEIRGGENRRPAVFAIPEKMKINKDVS